MILANYGVVSSSGGAINYDADALAFLTAASITDNTQKTAVNTLVTDLKAYNIWTKMKAVYPFVGGSATSHKFNLKDPRDLDAAYRLVFNGGWTHSNTGALPNGTTGYANTFFAPLAQSMSTSSFHLTNYARQAATNGTSRAYIGSNSNESDTGDITIMGWLNAGSLEGGSIAGINDSSEYSPQPALTTSTAGLKILTTNGNRNARFYRNGIYQASEIAQTYNFNNYNLYLSAVNNRDIVTTVYSNIEHGFTSIGDGLSDTEAANLYTAVQSFNTLLARNV